jgi:predicted RNA binding protein YcfA (HicA-like mRNA interferase family)
MKSSQLIRVLRQDGWYKVSQRGSHIKMKHATKKGVVYVPDHGSKEVASGTAIHILKSAGLK